MAKIVLLQAIYNPLNEQRKQEIDYCVAHNTENALIDKYLLMDGRPTFNQSFKVMRDYQKKRGGDNIFILANSDIYIPEETCELIKTYANQNNPKKTCLALSRWDMNKDGGISYYNHCDSQDTWVFFEPTPHITGADFFVGGRAGIDNAIAYLLDINGYNIFNPSLDIKTIHIHNVDYRSYTQSGSLPPVPPPYKLLPPSKLFN